MRHIRGKAALEKELLHKEIEYWEGLIDKIRSRKAVLDKEATETPMFGIDAESYCQTILDSLKAYESNDTRDIEDQIERWEMVWKYGPIWLVPVVSQIVLIVILVTLLARGY